MNSNSTWPWDEAFVFFSLADTKTKQQNKKAPREGKKWCALEMERSDPQPCELGMTSCTGGEIVRWGQKMCTVVGGHVAMGMGVQKGKGWHWFHCFGTVPNCFVVRKYLVHKVFAQFAIVSTSHYLRRLSTTWNLLKVLLKYFGSSDRCAKASSLSFDAPSPLFRKIAEISACVKISCSSVRELSYAAHFLYRKGDVTNICKYTNSSW